MKVRLPQARSTSRSSAPARSAARSPESSPLRVAHRADRGRRRTSAPERARRTRRSSTPASTPSRHARGAAGRARLRAAQRLRRAGRHPDRARPGALMVAWDHEQLAALAGDRRQRAGERLRRRRGRVEVEELYAPRAEPRPGAEGALEVPGEGIVCPFTPPLAFATQAVLAGVELRLERAVTACGRAAGRLRDRDRAAARWPRAGSSTPPGCAATRSTAMAGHERVHGHAEARGADRLRQARPRPLVNHILLPVPTEKTKGVLVAPTVYGNVMLGPTADDVDDKDETGSTTATGLASLLRGTARASCPRLVEQEVTAIYVGLRAATEHARLPARRRRRAALRLRRRDPLDRAHRLDGDRRARARRRSARAGLELRRAGRRAADVRMPNIGEATPRPYQDASAIAARPRLRADRLLLRAGHPRRDSRRAARARSRRPTSTGCAAAPAR